MQCSNVYISRFAEIKVLASLAEADTEPNGDIARANAITRSGLVLLCGYFEGFIREMCKEFVNAVNDLQLAAKELPLSLLSEHSTHCLEKYKQQNPSLFAGLVSGLSEDRAVSLNSDKLSATNANPTVDNIERLFNAFDMPLILDVITMEDFSFDSMYNSESQLTAGIRTAISSLSQGDLAKEAELSQAIENKWSPKLKRRRVGYLNIIDELLKKRNRIAHGESFEIVTYQELDDTTDSIIRLCTKLVSKLEAKLQQLSP
ncbi:MAE_28990/MAE_18760 family HEPN-like nuclease [Cronobacter sakazakii]|uniref:MAE_28990/MAE_18760 family HEPN-like nuclease n=1 Tax=Cronobacter sakazakii TaxID=28141 RepID=UPI0015C56786|nr:MAE_28990/MAE_18760 family HEPN-like nuclease [Cronobacter sakazakii]